MRWFLTFLFALSFVSLPVSAANIHGNIYDFSLNKIGNVIVEIDTIPKQFYVSKNGTYSFAVPIGFYEVKAQHYDRGLLISSTSENMTVKDGGDYILDLVLFPIIDEEELLEDEIKISKGNFYSGYFIFPVVILIILAVFLYFYNKKKIVKKEAAKKGEEDEKKVVEPDFYGQDISEKILGIIKEEGGRTTQKEIRKKIPLSEAKISLIITELETKDKIQKIKKGRGNIVILR